MFNRLQLTLWLSFNIFIVVVDVDVVVVEKLFGFDLFLHRTLARMNTYEDCKTEVKYSVYVYTPACR